MSREPPLLPEGEFCLANPKPIAHAGRQVRSAIDKTRLGFLIGANKPNRRRKSPIDPWKRPASPRGRRFFGPSEPQTKLNAEPRRHPLRGQGAIPTRRIDPRTRTCEQAMRHESGMRSDTPRVCDGTFRRCRHKGDPSPGKRVAGRPKSAASTLASRNMRHVQRRSAAAVHIRTPETALSISVAYTHRMLGIC